MKQEQQYKNIYRLEMDNPILKQSKPRAEKYDTKLAINTDFETAVKAMFKNADKVKQPEKKK
jgi:hypothetical protein